MRRKKEKASFQLSALALERLDKMADELGVSRAEVVRRAIGVYDWFVDQAKAEKRVLVRDKDGRLEGVVLDPTLHQAQEKDHSTEGGVSNEPDGARGAA